MKSYNTKARKYILEFLEKSEKTVSVAEILAYLNNNDVNINQTTVYRYLNHLLDEGRVLRIVDGASKKALYQLARDETCEGHIHIKCISCGKLEHLDCDFMNELSEHIKENHRFDLKCDNSVLSGVCEECKK